MNQPLTSLIPQDIPVRSSQFIDSVFGTLPKLRLPLYLFNKGHLTLDNSSLNVLIALYHIQKLQTFHRKYIPTGIATVTADRDSLIKFTGMNKNVIAEGIQTLHEARWINPLRQSFTSNQFQLLNPSNGHVLPESKTLLRGNDNGMRYFNIPECLLKNDIQWAQMPLAERRIYIAIAQLANRIDCKSPKVKTLAIELMEMTDIYDERTFKKALTGLQDRWLVYCASLLTMKHPIELILRNPLTYDLCKEIYKDIKSNPINYYSTVTRKKANFKMSAAVAKEQCLKLLAARGETAIESNGELIFKCPFPNHADDTPSFSFNPTRQCFYCHGCKASGYMTNLFTELGLPMEDIGKAAGECIEYIDPDSEAEAIYVYPNKEVLRYADKVFRQRQRDTDGQYVWNINGIKPTLYSGNNHEPMHHQDHLKEARTVIITEGERDADTVTRLGLTDSTATSRVIGVTSGGSSSWEPNLAKQLAGKRVIILPDDDAAGTAYANEIEESLKSENIEYRRANFAGTGCKDVSDYMKEHNEEELIRLIGINWLRMPSGKDVDDLNVVHDPEDIGITI
jgi:5S rRNA maturation endonuclease (ribonuclease M5)